MANEIDDARKALHATLVAWTADVLDPERVHPYVPEIINNPCLWLSQPGVNTVLVGSPGARLRVITFDVYIVADGVAAAQMALLDELVARVSDAIQELPYAEDNGAEPQSLDIGGVTTRAVVYSVGITTAARTFCPPIRPTPPVPLLEEIH